LATAAVQSDVQGKVFIQIVNKGNSQDEEFGVYGILRLDKD